MEIVGRFHGLAVADSAKAEFINRFSEGKLPDRIDSYTLSAEQVDYLEVVQILKEVGFCKSTSEARRMIKQGAVRVDQERISSESMTIPVGSTVLIEVGKRRIGEVTIN